jgi:UDPglucose--hexose-1-phosphate uridylyltransferase
MALLKTAILENKDIRADETLEKHADWTDEIKAKYTDINVDNIDKIIEDEIGIVFAKVLSHAGVFKNTEDFLRFTKAVK